MRHKLIKTNMGYKDISVGKFQWQNELLKNGVQFLYFSNFVELIFEVWSGKK